MWLLDQDSYRQARARWSRGEPAALAAGVALRTQAAALCGAPAPAVTDKAFTRHSPSRDPHDYVSIATYFWPHPANPDGLPYHRRDGELSPDLPLYDRPRWEAAAAGIVTAVRAAWLLGETRFAEDAARRLRGWFLDPATRMNPQLRHAQMIPGQTPGRCYGVIDFALHLPCVLEHALLLGRLPASPWTTADAQALQAWNAQLLVWLENDPLGREEERTPNNHGTCYDRLVVHLARYLDRPERAAVQLERTRSRIGSQIAPDGSMPHELDRTCSFGYSLMNARAFVELAWMGRDLVPGLWDWQAPNGASIRLATDGLWRFLTSPAAWPRVQIEPIDWRMAWPLYRVANRLGGGPYPLAGLAHRLPLGFDPELFALAEPMHPFGQERSA